MSPAEVGSEMMARIRRRLLEIEAEQGVRILYACESGSRAWGFSSADSDYDVRFLYVQPLEWYLSIDTGDRRDVIEMPIAQDLDISGWELRKAMRLFYRSNPPLLEWLGSPVAYLERGELARRLRGLTRASFSLEACRYHYLSMATKNYRGYLRGPEVRLKKYLYVLRPILAVKWIDAGLGVVPTELSRLLERMVPPGELRDAIEELIEHKRRGFEGAVGPAIAPIDAFLAEELERLSAERPREGQGPGGLAELNRLFRATLTKSWKDRAGPGFV